MTNLRTQTTLKVEGSDVRFHCTHPGLPDLTFEVTDPDQQWPVGLLYLYGDLEAHRAFIEAYTASLDRYEAKLREDAA